ncbi:hypothetical protein DFH06DRAFT_1468069 [Mycena polygramma]|nr:hypothetical protein DFH06DRAFT_1468069 [Mycena polygramma]
MEASHTMVPTSRTSSSCIPVPRSSLAPASPAPAPRSFTASAASHVTMSTAKYTSHLDFDAPSDEESAREQENADALALRHTSSTPAFTQSSKFSRIRSPIPPVPMLHHGQGYRTLPRLAAQGGISSDSSTSTSSSLSRKPSSSASNSSTSWRGLSRKLSRFRLRGSEDESGSISTDQTSSFSSGSSEKPSRIRRSVGPSKTNLHSSDESSSDAGSSLCSISISGTPILNEKPLPEAPLFSPCTSPIDEYNLDNDPTPSAEAAPARQLSRFQIRRKPVPEYFPDTRPVPDSDSSSAYSTSSGESSAEGSAAIQIVGPNVFIAYDNDATSTLTAAFTHIVRLLPADAIGAGVRHRAEEVEFEPQTGVHTLYLPVPRPVAPPHIFSDFSAIDESHCDIRFASTLTDTVDHAKDRRTSASIRPPSATSPSASKSDHRPRRSDSQLSHADLVATQDFLAASGRIVSLPELAYFLTELSAQAHFTDPPAPPLGLQPAHIDAVLSFLRPHPFAPATTRRVLLVAPRGDAQLVREGLALMACYLARVEGWGVRFALRKFEASVGTVGRRWRGLLGREGAVAEYLEELAVV